MPIPRPLITLLLFLLALPAFGAADQAEREALRFNDAITKLMQTRDEAQTNHQAKAIAALTAMAKSRTKAEDTAGTTEVWRAILMIDREHSDARAYFTLLGTLDAVLVSLDVPPADLLGQDSAGTPAKPDSGAAPAKPVTKNGTTEKAP